MLSKEMFCLVSFFVISLVLSSNVRSQQSVAKSKLKVRGTVVAYKAPSVFSQTSFLGVTNILVVRVSKVLKGKEKAHYLIVRFTGDRSDYAPQEFAGNKILDFNLERADFCDMKLLRVLEIDLRNDDGDITDTLPNLEVLPTVRKDSLPLTETLPCYFVSNE